jgi:hypothetical protein
MGKHAFERAVVVDVPESAWEPTGSEEDPTSRLLAALVVCGYYHHLEAYAVKEDPEGYQQIADPLFSENFEGMCSLGGPDGPFQTITIKGREYVLAMTPYC